jgi:membrane fusion protein, type I secretion system
MSMQHLEGGTVRDIRVQEADVVTAGDTLIVLDSIEARSNLTLLQQRLNIDRAAEARLLGEHEFAETIEFPADLAESSEQDLQNTLLTQQDIFDDRREIIASEAEILEFRLTQFDEQINGLEIQKNAIEKRAAHWRCGAADDRRRPGRD